MFNQTSWQGQLTPNCLMTQKALVFVSTRKVLFFGKSYWQLIPSFLLEHGYEVFQLQLPNSNPHSQELALLKLRHHIEDLHLFIDPSLTPLFNKLILKNTLRPRSLTPLVAHPIEDKGFQQQLLEKVQTLAETDYRLAHQKSLAPNL